MRRLDISYIMKKLRLFNICQKKIKQISTTILSPLTLRNSNALSFDAGATSKVLFSVPDPLLMQVNLKEILSPRRQRSGKLKLERI